MHLFQTSYNWSVIVVYVCVYTEAVSQMTWVKYGSHTENRPKASQNLVCNFNISLMSSRQGSHRVNQLVLGNTLRAILF